MPAAVLGPGRLLVATPVLTGGPFARAVVQLLEHSETDGALGVVLNASTDAALADVLPGWALLAPDPVVVFEGGPVEQTVVVCLGRLPIPAPADPSYVGVPGAPWLATVDLAPMSQRPSSRRSASSRATPAGHPDSWRPRSSRAAGGCSTPCRAMPSRARRSCCGGRC